MAYYKGLISGKVFIGANVLGLEHKFISVSFIWKQLFNNLISGCFGKGNAASLVNDVLLKIEGAVKELEDIQIVI